MFRWRRCSECRLSDWQRAKKLLLKFRQVTRECSEIATKLAVKIRRGTWAPPLTGPHSESFADDIDIYCSNKLKIFIIMK